MSNKRHSIYVCTKHPGLGEIWSGLGTREQIQARGCVLCELDYAYRCITGGYRQGVFDFSVLKARAFEFTGLEEYRACEHCAAGIPRSADGSRHESDAGVWQCRAFARG